jgi:hypothetical protein
MSSLLHRVRRDLAFYGHASIVILPCAVAYGLLVAEGLTWPWLAFPLILGVIGGLFLANRAESKPKPKRVEQQIKQIIAVAGYLQKDRSTVRLTIGPSSQSAQATARTVGNGAF